MAKTARYKGDKLAMFAEMKTAVEADYQIQTSDETRLGVASKPKWYTLEGMVVTRTGSPQRGEPLVPDGSVNFAVVAEILPDGDMWVVKVTPVMQQFQIGSPQPQPLKEDSANVPGWARSRVDTLALEIHKRLQKFEVKGVPQSAPPPTETTPPSTGAPGETPATAPAPADGSAAAPATP